MSQETADLLTRAGKGRWLVPRQDVIATKWNDAIPTFWLTSQVRIIHENEEKTEKRERLVLWVAEAFTTILKQLHGQRQSLQTLTRPTPSSHSVHRPTRTYSNSVLDERCEVITIPSYSQHPHVDLEDVVLDKKATEQLKSFIRAISDMCK